MRLDSVNCLTGALATCARLVLPRIMEQTADAWKRTYAKGARDRGRRMRALIVYACAPPRCCEESKLVGLSRRAQGTVS
jgi:hypothetical protein